MIDLEYYLLFLETLDINQTETDVCLFSGNRRRRLKFQ